jgi:hypothetical protein
MVGILWHAHRRRRRSSLPHKRLSNAAILTGACTLPVILALGGCGGPPGGAIRGVGGEAEIVFAAGEGVSSKKYIVLEDVSLSTAVELGNALVEPNEAVFKPVTGKKSTVVKEGVNVEVEPCKFPPAGEELEKRVGACVIGVEYIANSPGTTNTFAQEYGSIGSPKEGKAMITVRHE